MSARPRTGAPPAADLHTDHIRAIANSRDTASFCALFLHFAPRVKAYLVRLGIGDAAAEELAQETLLMVWRKAAQFDPARASASTWIFTIARNLRVDMLRRMDKPRGVPFELGWLDPEEPLGFLCAGEARGRIHDALRALSSTQHEVVRLFFLEDRPHSEIARLLGLPLGTVKSRLRAAVLKLRHALNGKG